MHTEIAHYAVKDLIPGFFDVAGLADEAEAMRGSDVLSAAHPGVAAAILRATGADAVGRWAEAVREVCFWAEALVWAEWNHDAVLLEEARARLVQAISDGYDRAAAH